MGELLTVAGLIKVLKVLVVDLFLAGDNAILISMVAGHLEHDLRKKSYIFRNVRCYCIEIGSCVFVCRSATHNSISSPYRRNFAFVDSY